MRISDWSSDVCSSDLGMATAIPSGIFSISDIRGSRPSRLAAASLSNSGMISPAQRKQPIQTALLDVLYVGAAVVQPSPWAQPIADRNKGNGTPMVRFHSEHSPPLLKPVGAVPKSPEVTGAAPIHTC